MSTLSSYVTRLRNLDLERSLGLRANYPPVALQLDRNSISLVRLKSVRRGKPLLEALHRSETESTCVPASIFEPPPAAEELVPRLKALFESSGTRPGRVSLVLPDNLAKVTLLRLPERPASTRQLDELVRAQIRRGVPFKLDDARLSYQPLPTTDGSFVLLVVVVRRSLVEQYEQALDKIGARLGLVDLVTPNLINLCRGKIDASKRKSGDFALLNCDRSYFSLAIVRGDQLIFLRCKSYPSGSCEDDNGMLLREVSNSFSYYEEKLQGQGVGTLLLRDLHQAHGDIARRLEPLGLGEPLPLSPLEGLTVGPATRFDPSLAVELAPAIGAAAGRK